MATRYRFGDGDYAHFVTFAVVNWVDALSRPQYKDILVESIKYCIVNKGLQLHAWVIMNNHVHLIISSEGNKLEDIMRDLKRHTSKELLEAIDNNLQESRRNWMMWLFRSAGIANSNNKNYQFWQQDNHPVQLTNSEIMLQKLNYIHNNPVRAGFVHEPQHYVYSSAGDYIDNKPGIISLVRLL
ncbi:MAG: transposase [Bacteroidetes bacterium]|nr:transposase [Bacteroidota bacterium]